MIAGLALTVGLASWYDLPGSRMAGGDVFEPYNHVCAMRTADHRQRVVIVNLGNGRRSWCKVSDYGPAAWTGRVIDLSPRVRDDLGFYPGQGLAKVEVYQEIVPFTITVRF